MPILQIAVTSFDRSWIGALRAALGLSRIESIAAAPAGLLHRFDVIVAGGPGIADALAIQQVRAIRQCAPSAPIILVVDKGSEEIAVEALRQGANEYLRQPSPEELANAVRRLSGGQAEDGGDMVGASDAMERTRQFIRQVAPADSNVLITGETGTGKELAAQMIHRFSPRAAGPFLCVNCAAIPDNLLESELFGHERGAFTGAVGARAGAIQAADRGTLLLDEIGEMSPFAQAKLLRVLDSHQVQRLGATKTVQVDVRVLAATNRDLECLTRDKGFRMDLFYRLNVARLRLAPLRERKEDLPALVDHAIQGLNRRFGANVKGLSDEALTALCRHAWPGNVRELKNLLEGAFILKPNAWIGYPDLPEDFRRQIGDPEARREDEKDRLLEALVSTRWNCTEAAARLNWSRMTLYRKMAKHHLSRVSRATSA